MWGPLFVQNNHYELVVFVQYAALILLLISSKIELYKKIENKEIKHNGDVTPGEGSNGFYN